MLTRRSNISAKSSWQALELIGYLSEVVVLQQLLLRNKRKLLNGRFNKTDYYSSGKKVGEGEMELYSKRRRRELTSLLCLCRVESLRIHLKAKIGYLLYS